MKHPKRLLNKLSALWQMFLQLVSIQCGGDITGKNIALAFTGLAVVVLLVVAWGFLVAVVYTPYC